MLHHCLNIIMGHNYCNSTQARHADLQAYVLIQLSALLSLSALVLNNTQLEVLFDLQPYKNVFPMAWRPLNHYMNKKFQFNFPSLPKCVFWQSNMFIETLKVYCTCSFILECQHREQDVHICKSVERFDKLLHCLSTSRHLLCSYE